MEVSYTIDWLSVTSEKPYYHPGLTMYCVERERGSKGYTIVVEFEDGRLEMLNPDRPEMGVHVEYSGSALNTIECEYGVPKIEVLACGGDDVKASRLDIAVDVKGSGMRVCALVDAVKAGYCKTLAKKTFEIKSVGEEGHTLYIGSASSPARLRIYDKAAEQGVDGDWIRIELQLRSVKARNARSQLLGTGNRSQSISSIINRFARFDLPIWTQIMSGEMSPALPGETSHGNTDEWLLKTVAKTLATRMEKNGGNQFWERFCDSVDGYAQEYRKGRKKRRVAG